MLIFYWAWFGLLIPFVLLYCLLLFKPNLTLFDNVLHIRFPHADILAKYFKSTKSVGKSSNKLLIVLLALFWLSLILAIMRPQKLDSFVSLNSHGHDMLLAVDISKSMDALDFEKYRNRKTRLDATKEVVSEFIKNRQGDQLGLILFAEKAYLTVPMTIDLLSLSHMLDNAETGMAGVRTSIGDAIALSVLTLREREVKSRILILLTDGEDNASTIPPMQAAQIASDYNIKIYTIGIGSPRNEPVPYINNFGIRSSFIATIDEELLKNISSKTGGKYFLASNEDSLKKIYDEINKLEKVDLSATTHIVRTSLYHYPLTAAVIIFLFIILLPLFKMIFVKIQSTKKVNNYEF